MKAAVLYANEDIRYAEWETPACGDNEVKVRVRATGICGSDVPRVLHNGAHFYPVVLGHEFSGDVVETGKNVTKIKVGDTVSGAPLLPCMECVDCKKGDYSLCKHYSFIGSRQQGSFADYVVIPEVNAVRYEFCCNSRAVCLFALSVLIIKYYIPIQKFCQFFLKTQCRCIQRRMFQLLHDTDCIFTGCIFGRITRTAAACQR